MATQNYGTVPSRNSAVNAEKKPQARGIIQRAMTTKRKKVRRPKR